MLQVERLVNGIPSLWHHFLDAFTGRYKRCTSKYKPILNQVKLFLHLHSLSCLSQKTVNGLFRLRVELPPAQLSKTRRRLHIVPLIVERQAANCEYQLLEYLV